MHADPFAQTMTAERCDELLRAARERRLRKRADLLNRIWWATQENNFSARERKQRTSNPELTGDAAGRCGVGS